MLFDISAALPTFVVTLREGVEAALVVGIVLAYLKKAEQTQLNPWVYSGIFSGIGASALVGVLFNWGMQQLEASNPEFAPVIEPLLEGVFGVLAIALLSWMLIWMTQQAKQLKSEVEGAIGSVLQQESANWGVFSLIFIAVLREGFETVLFIAAKFQQGLMPALGAIAGLIGATGIGVLLFKWGVKINLRQFFQVMGLFLLLIVAGLVISALGHFDEALATLATINPQFSKLCVYYDGFAQHPACILGPQIWDTRAVLPEKKFPGIALHALLGYQDELYLVQAIGYGLFLLTVGMRYLQSITGANLGPAKTDGVQQ